MARTRLEALPGPISTTSPCAPAHSTDELPRPSERQDEVPRHELGSRSSRRPRARCPASRETRPTTRWPSTTRLVLEARVLVPPTRTASVTGGEPRSAERDKTIRRVTKVGRKRWKEESAYHQLYAPTPLGGRDGLDLSAAHAIQHAHHRIEVGVATLTFQSVRGSLPHRLRTKKSWRRRKR
jgi:hypothetical protein